MHPGASWEFDSALFRWDAAEALWVFAALPESVSDDLDAAAPLKGGFGSVRVDVQLGGSRWSTSVFPDTARGCYVLPIKKAVRRAEGVDLGETVRIRVSLPGERPPTAD